MSRTASRVGRGTLLTPLAGGCVMVPEPLRGWAGRRLPLLVPPSIAGVLVLLGLVTASYASSPAGTGDR